MLVSSPSAVATLKTVFSRQKKMTGASCGIVSRKKNLRQERERICEVRVDTEQSKRENEYYWGKERRINLKEGGRESNRLME
jgi:hypothetical protein